MENSQTDPRRNCSWNSQVNCLRNFQRNYSEELMKDMMEKLLKKYLKATLKEIPGETPEIFGKTTEKNFRRKSLGICLKTPVGNLEDTPETIPVRISEAIS